MSNWMDEVDNVSGVSTTKNLPQNAPGSNLPPFDIKLEKGQDPEKVAREIAAQGFVDKPVKKNWMDVIDGGSVDVVKSEGSKIESMSVEQQKDISEREIKKLEYDLGVREKTGAWEAANLGAKAGAVGLAESVNTALQYIGNRVGSKELVRIGKENYEFWHKMSKEYEMPEDISGDILDDPSLIVDPAFLAYTFAQTGVSILPSLVVGAGGAKAAYKGVKVLGSVVKLTPKVMKRLVALGGIIPAGVVVGGQEGTDTYQEMLERGATEEQAARAMEAMTTASGVLNSISFGKMGIFNKLSKPERKTVGAFIKKFITSGATEAFTEYAEEPIEILIKHNLLPKGMTKDEIVAQLKSGANVIPAASGLGGVGGAAGLVMKQTRTPSTPQDASLTGVGEQSPPQDQQSDFTAVGSKDVDTAVVENPVKTIVRKAVEKNIANIDTAGKPIAPLRPEAKDEIDPMPTAPLGEGWESDRGAMPGEPSQIYKEKAAIIENVDDEGKVLYEATTDEGLSLGIFEDIEQARKAAEYYVDGQKVVRNASDVEAVDTRQTQPVKEDVEDWMSEIDESVDRYEVPEESTNTSKEPTGVVYGEGFNDAKFSDMRISKPPRTKNIISESTNEFGLKEVHSRIKTKKLDIINLYDETGEIIGGISQQKYPNGEVRIGEIYLEPEYRGRGIAQYLYSKFPDAAPGLARTEAAIKARNKYEKEKQISSSKRDAVVPVHGTSLDKLDSILSGGLKAGSALDLTKDMDWASKYEVIITVPKARAGDYVEHNKFYKSANKAKATEVTIDMGAFTPEGADVARSQIIELKKKYPNVKFKILNDAESDPEALTTKNIAKLYKEKYKISEEDALEQAKFEQELGFVHERKHITNISKLNKYLDDMELDGLQLQLDRFRSNDITEKDLTSDIDKSLYKDYKDGLITDVTSMKERFDKYVEEERQISDWKKQAEENNVIFEGVQRGRNKEILFPSFTGDFDGVRSSFALEPGETVAEAIKRKQEQKKRVDKNYLVSVGTKVFDSGNKEFFTWKKEVKKDLGDKWNAYKSLISEVWKIVNNERGSFSWNQKTKAVKEAAKAGKVAEARQAIEELKKEYFYFVKGNKLDQSAMAYLKSGKFEDYVENMPTLGEITPKEVFKYSESAGKVIATLWDKDGKIKPAIRKSGFHALQEFEDGIKNYKDIGKFDRWVTDPTRLIQAADQGLFGGMLQKHILWPIHSTVMARLHWSDVYKTGIMKIQEKYDIYGKKKLELTGEVVEAVETDPKTGKTTLDVVKVEELLKDLSKEEGQKIIDAAEEFRTMWNRLLDEQNMARAKRGEKPIPRRTFYRPHVMKINIWSKVFGEKHNKNSVMESISPPDTAYPDKSFNPRAEKRYDALMKEQLEKNVVQLMADYVDVAGKDIFYSNIIQNTKIHTAVMRKHGLENAANAVDAYVAEAYAGVDSPITRLAKSTIPSYIREPILKLRRNLTRAVFPLNVKWNLFIQTTSAGLTAARYGIGNSIKGLQFFTDSALRSAIDEVAYSKVIKERWVGSMAYQDLSVGGLAKMRKLEGTKIDTAEHYANFLTRAIENGLTGHAIVAAYSHGKKLGLTGRALWEYASEGGAKTQSMYNPEDSVGLLRARDVGAAAPFQTFAFEMFNSARELNIPGVNLIIGKTGAYETIAANSAQGKGLLRNRMKILALWFACALVTNAVVDEETGRKPWDISSIIPFYGIMSGLFFDESSTRGLPTPAQYVRDLKRGVEELYVHGSFKRLRRWALRYHMIGGTQIERTLAGFEASVAGAVHDVTGKELFKVEGAGEAARAIVAGPWGTKAGMQYWKDREEKQDESSSWSAKRNRRKESSKKLKTLDSGKANRLKSL